MGDAYLLAAAGEAEVAVEKSRDGKFADFVPGWRKETMRFGDFLRDYAGGDGGDGDSGGGGGSAPPMLYLAEETIPEPLLDDVPFFKFASFLDVEDRDTNRKMWMAYNPLLDDGRGGGDGVGGAGGGGVGGGGGGGKGAGGGRSPPTSMPHTDNFENILVQLEGAKVGAGFRHRPPRHRHALFTLIARVNWHPITW